MTTDQIELNVFSGYMSPEQVYTQMMQKLHAAKQENKEQAERIANLNKMITRLRDQLTVAIELMESGR